MWAFWLTIGAPPALFAADLQVSPPDDPAADAAPIIAAAVERAIATGADRVVVAPGTYHVRGDTARGSFVSVSNNDAGLRRTAFPVWKAKRLVIDGTGARLVLHGQGMMAFMIYDSEDVEIRGFEIDWDRALYAQAKVIAVDAAGDAFEAEFLPECNVRLQDGQIVHGLEPATSRKRMPWQLQPSQSWRQDLRWNYWINPEEREAMAWDRQLTFSPWNDHLQRPAEISVTGPNRFRFRHAWSGLPAIGSVFVAKGMLMPNRMSPAIHLARSRGVTVENVVVRHAGAMGLIAESSSNVTLRHFDVRLPHGSARLVTTTADAAHFAQCSGRILIEDCYMECMLDDALNVHGVYARIGGVRATTIEISFGYFQQLGMDFARAGDRVRFCRQETLLPVAEATVSAVRQINEDRVEIELVEAPPPAARDCVLENASRQPELVFRRNVIRGNRGRGVLATTAGAVLIEDNRFEHPGGGGLGVTILIEGDAASWHESGAVRDVTIRNNVFLPLRPDAAVIKISPQQPATKEVQPPYHRNITIENNVFRVVGPRLLEANRTSNLRFNGNTVVTAKPGLRMEPAPAFNLRACENVFVIGNRIELSEPATVKQVTPTARLTVRDNTGLSPNVADTGRLNP